MQSWFPALSRRIVLCMLLLAPAGCAAGQLVPWKKNEVPKADANNPAVRIVCIWEPAEGQFKDRPTRGFAGQILFFNRSNDAPVEVDGTVRIYVFDDRGSPEQRAKPIHQFDFPSESWKLHRQKTMLGIAYNVFIPFTGKHPWQTTCGLRVRFTPTSGPTIFSEMVHVMLPGPIEKTAVEPDAKSPAPRAPRLTVDEPKLSELPLGAMLKRRKITHGRSTASDDGGRLTSAADVRTLLERAGVKNAGNLVFDEQGAEETGDRLLNDQSPRSQALLGNAFPRSSAARVAGDRSKRSFGAVRSQAGAGERVESTQNVQSPGDPQAAISKADGDGLRRSDARGELQRENRRHAPHPLAEPDAPLRFQLAPAGSTGRRAGLSESGSNARAVRRNRGELGDSHKTNASGNAPLLPPMPAHSDSPHGNDGLSRRLHPLADL